MEIGRSLPKFAKHTLVLSTFWYSHAFHYYLSILYHLPVNVNLYVPRLGLGRGCIWETRRDKRIRDFNNTK